MAYRKAIVVLVPTLIFGLGAPAWSGTDAKEAPIDAEVLPSSSNVNTLLGLLSSVLTSTDPNPRLATGECKPSQLYSQHDVVGDPEACFRGRYNFGTGPNATAVP